MRIGLALQHRTWPGAPVKIGGRGGGANKATADPVGDPKPAAQLSPMHRMVSTTLATRRGRRFAE